MAQPRARRKLSDGPRPVHRRVLWHRPGDDPGASRAATGDPGRTYPLPSGSLRRFTVQPTVDAAIAAGPFDGLISNAGETVRGTVEATPLSEYERLLGLNFLGALCVTKAVLSGFRERGAAGSCRFPHITQQRRTHVQLRIWPAAEAQAAEAEPGDRVERRAVFGKACHGDELRFGSLDVSG